MLCEVKETSESFSEQKYDVIYTMFLEFVWPIKNYTVRLGWSGRHVELWEDLWAVQGSCDMCLRNRCYTLVWMKKMPLDTPICLKEREEDNSEFVEVKPTSIAVRRSSSKFILSISKSSSKSSAKCKSKVSQMWWFKNVLLLHVLCPSWKCTCWTDTMCDAFAFR